jgi:uncharacterized protein YecT (DUF1311 family)
MLAVVKCAKCGADAEYEAESVSLKCPYCGDVQKLSERGDDLPAQPSKIVPLSVGGNALLAAVRDYMASGVFTPIDLLELAQITNIERMYVPCYLFGNACDSDSYRLVAYAGSSITSPEAIALIQSSASLSKMTAFDPSFAAGIDVEPYAMSEERAFSERADGRQSQVIGDLIKRHARVDGGNNSKRSSDYFKDTDSVLFPICHVEFSYKNKRYNYWCDGACIGNYVADGLPTDDKLEAIAGSGSLPPAVLFLSMLCISIIGDKGVRGFTLYGIAALVCLIICGMFLRASVLSCAVRIRKALLAQKAERQNMGASFRTPKGAFLLNENFLPPIAMIVSIATIVFAVDQNYPRSVWYPPHDPEAQQTDVPPAVATAAHREPEQLMPPQPEASPSPPAPSKPLPDPRQQAAAPGDGPFPVAEGVSVFPHFVAPPGYEHISQAGFNCSAAHTPMEFLICGNKELSFADGTLAAVYRNALGQAKPAEAEQLKVAHKQWHKDRDLDCGAVWLERAGAESCVMEKIQARLSVLLAPHQH